VLPKLKLLFLCTGNSCRSQGWARHLKGEMIDPYSAGPLSKRCPNPSAGSAERPDGRESVVWNTASVRLLG